MKKLVLCLALLGSPAFADSQMFPPGAPIAPGQLGHIFDAACFASQPGMIADRAAIVESVFKFEPADLGGVAGWVHPNGAISLNVSGDILRASCEMSVVADLGGDGADLYDSLAAHLPRSAEGTEAEAVEGGLQWAWDNSGVRYSLTFVELEGAFLITYEAAR